MWGRGAANGDQTHIKDISEVPAFQPCPLNSLNHWGVAVKTGSVHLINILKGPEGRGRPHPHHHHHPVPQGPPFSAECWLATRSPQAIPQSQKCTQLLHKGSTTQELTSFPGWAGQHHHTHFTLLLLFIWPYCPYNRTGVVCHCTAMASPSNCTFDLLPHPPKQPLGQRSH